MNTQKHDQLMARTIPISVEVMAGLAHEANALQADVVAEADAHRVTRDRLAASNEARHVLVTELAQLDVWRETAEALRSQLDTVRQQLTIERSKHAKATGHIANMATGRGWLPGKGSVEIGGQHMSQEAFDAARLPVVEEWRHGRAVLGAAQDELRAFREQHDPIVRALQSELDSVRRELADKGEASQPEATAAAQPRPFKAGDRVERGGTRGVVVNDDGSHADSGLPFDVKWDDESAQEWCNASELTRIEWEPGEGIEVGAEVEYVGNDQGRFMYPGRVGSRGTVEHVAPRTAIVTGIADLGVLKINLRRIS